MVRKLFKHQTQSKRGVASLYVVIFATILFGIVSLSFMRIILSEAGQSSDDDLSRSAYDAALAGVEDAKRAVNTYYRCLQLGSSGLDCTQDKRKALFRSDCDTSEGIGIASYLGITYNSEEGVFIQENSSASSSTFADQAYTCVVVSDKVPDYRGTLTDETRTKVVPLNIAREMAPGEVNSSEFAGVKKITVEWYSQLNMGNSAELFYHLGNRNEADGGKSAVLEKFDNSPIPPTITATLIIAKKDAKREDFYQANNYNMETGSDKVIYSTKVLVPGDADPQEEITWSDILKSGNVVKSMEVETGEEKQQHKTIGIKPESRREFACKFSFDISGAGLSGDDTAVLVLSLPYGNVDTDFSVKMKKDDINVVDFTGAQISVDSTGRTNQLLRRVEVRLDPADLFFPYPQYEVDLSGSGDDIFKKDFWITANCWRSQPDDWKETECDQNNRTDT